MEVLVDRLRLYLTLFGPTLALVALVSTTLILVLL